MLRETEEQKEAHRIANRKYAKKHPDRIKETNKNQYVKNKENIRIQQKEYHKENIEEIMKRKNKYYQDNKEKAKEYSKQNRKTLKTRLGTVYRRSIRDNREYNLDLEWLESLPLICFYTGVELTLDTNERNTLSFDRFDNSKGYTKENVVLCCDVINKMKSNLHVEEMCLWFEKVVTNKDKILQGIN